YAFEEMGFHRLEATILETNRASLAAYQACGYRVEGTLREHALRGGARVNRLVLGLLASEVAPPEAGGTPWARGQGVGSPPPAPPPILGEGSGPRSRTSSPLPQDWGRGRGWGRGN